jgi:ribose transport system ATP-binding protein
MIGLADRIVVMNDYKVCGELANDGLYDGMSQGIMRLIHQDAQAA